MAGCSGSAVGGYSRTCAHVQSQYSCSWQHKCSTEEMVTPWVLRVEDASLSGENHGCVKPYQMSALGVYSGNVISKLCTINYVCKSNCVESIM